MTSLQSYRKIAAFLVVGAPLFAQQIDWNTQIANKPNIPSSASANQVYASPNGASGAMSPRALVGADIPPISLANSGNGGVTGNLQISNFNGGLNANSGTLWGGDGTWHTAPPGGNLTISNPAPSRSLVGLPPTITAATTVKPIGGVTNTNAYNWGYTPTNALTANTLSTITFSGTCPAGLTATTPNSIYFYISDGSSSEADIVSGGTCATGVSGGTIQFTPRNSHSLGYTIQSADQGINECLNDISASQMNGPGTCFIPHSQFTIHAPILFPNVAAIKLQGEGISRTILNFDSAFPCASGCTLFTGYANAQPGPSIEGITVNFTQPDSTNLATYTQYTCVDFHTNPGFVIRHLACTRDWDGINLSNGNAGGSIIEDFETSSFDKGIWIDGAEGTIYIPDFQESCMACTANQSAAFASTANTIYGFYIGRGDDIEISHPIITLIRCALFFNGTGVNPGDSFGTWTGGDCDGTQGLVMDASSGWQFSGVFFSQGPSAQSVISVYGGEATFSSIRIQATDSQPVVAVNSNVSSAPTVVNLVGGYITNTNGTGNLIYSSYASGDPSVLLVDGVTLDRTTNTTYTNPAISCEGSIAVCSIHNVNMDVGPGTGSGGFISVANDGYDNITGNTGRGYTNSFPAATHAIYANNN